ncbi:MAG: THUMP domain-containing protein [Gammaproteobacteria bacterium]|nr:THUMP domain-containing protein [Gammaproteobacteria bacterium]
MVLRTLDPNAEVMGDWDSLEVKLDPLGTGSKERIISKLACIPGISQFAEVEKFALPEMNGILAHALYCYGESLTGKTFAMRCKRRGKHSFSSVDVENYIGAGCNKKSLRRESGWRNWKLP